MNQSINVQGIERVKLGPVTELYPPESRLNRCFTRDLTIAGKADEHLVLTMFADSEEKLVAPFAIAPTKADIASAITALLTR